MIVKLLTEHHLEFLSLTGGCRGSSDSTLFKMTKCWKSHAAAQLFSFQLDIWRWTKVDTLVLNDSCQITMHEHACMQELTCLALREKKLVHR